MNETLKSGNISVLDLVAEMNPSYNPGMTAEIKAAIDGYFNVKVNSDYIIPANVLEALKSHIREVVISSAVDDAVSK